jgi:tetratricopeptide (TPR) repeat protein
MVAAAVVACLLLWPGQKANETASTPFWIERNLDEIAPRSGASSQATLQQGLRAYEHHDAARAVELLEKAAGEEGMDEIRRLYLASALLHVGRADESIRLLDELEPMTLPPPWRGDALWTLHAALLQNGRSTAADSLLEQMADIPGKTGQRARELRMH